MELILLTFFYYSILKFSNAFKSVSTLCLSNEKAFNLESPGFDRGRYPPDVERTWIFASTPQSSCVKFQLLSVDLADDDYIDIFDGVQVSTDMHRLRIDSTTNSTYSTNGKAFQPIITSKNVMMIIFESGATAGSRKKQGFRAKLTLASCRSDLRQGHQLAFRSARWGRTTVLCLIQAGVKTEIMGLRRKFQTVGPIQTWLFISPPLSCITLKITTLNFQSNFGDQCKEDRMAVYDSHAASSVQPRLIACGSIKPSTSFVHLLNSVNSTKNALFVMVRHANFGRGENSTASLNLLFKIEVSVVKCGNNFECRRNKITRNGLPITSDNIYACGSPACSPQETGLLPTHIGVTQMDQSLFRPVDHSWPWQAEIAYCMTPASSSVEEPSDCQHICGGTLISKRHVLTAAHCFDHAPTSVENYRLRLGLVSGLLFSDEIQPTEQRPRIREILIHPRYAKASRFDADLAILRLEEPGVELDDYVRPICLPTDSALPSLGSVCYMTGFGSSGLTFRQIALPVIPNQLCSDRMTPSLRSYLNDNMLCAGYERGVHDSCRGDSGGPLACKLGRGNTWTLDGVVSFGSDRCAAANQSGVYVRVVRYLPFIKMNVYDLSI